MPPINGFGYFEPITTPSADALPEKDAAAVTKYHQAVNALAEAPTEKSRVAATAPSADRTARARMEVPPSHCPLAGSPPPPRRSARSST